MKTARQIKIFEAKKGNIYKLGFGEFGKRVRLLSLYFQKDKRNKWNITVEYED